jgi:hypothetical protein
VEQRNAGIAVGIVLDGGNLGRHPKLVATKIDYPIEPFVAAAPMAAGDYTPVVAPLGTVLGVSQRLSGSLRVISANSETVRSRVPGV